MCVCTYVLYLTRVVYIFPVNITKRVLTPQLNHISMKLPSVPLLSQRDVVDQNRFCNESTVQGCEQAYCACTHVLRVKLGSVVEVVLVDEGSYLSVLNLFKRGSCRI